MFFIGGVFGLTSMPYAFQCVKLAIVYELNTLILKEWSVIYVDNGCVVSPRLLTEIFNRNFAQMVIFLPFQEATL
jgi:hypothetical protein